MDPKIVLDTIAPWQNSRYFADAESKMGVFWGDNSIFRTWFEELDLSNVVELACGKGRHSEHIVSRAGILTLVDVFPEHIADCVKRLQGRFNVMYAVANGYNLSQIANGSQSAVFCYDAMVHFAPEIVDSYLVETSRILRPGGRALFHYSNYDAPDNRHYGQNPHARNKMTKQRFEVVANKAGLEVLRSRTIDWGGTKDLDAVTLLEKT